MSGRGAGDFPRPDRAGVRQRGEGGAEKKGGGARARGTCARPKTAASNFFLPQLTATDSGKKRERGKPSPAAAGTGQWPLDPAHCKQPTAHKPTSPQAPTQNPRLRLVRSRHLGHLVHRPATSLSFFLFCFLSTHSPPPQTRSLCRRSAHHHRQHVHGLAYPDPRLLGVGEKRMFRRPSMIPPSHPSPPPPPLPDSDSLSCP